MDATNWCQLKLKKSKPIGSLEDFILCSRALETYNTGAMKLILRKFKPKICNIISFVELQDPDVIALGGKISNGNWIWLKGNLFDKVDVGWSTFPPPEYGDCIGISRKATSASVFPCIYPKRVMCSYM